MLSPQEKELLAALIDADANSDSDEASALTPRQRQQVDRLLRQSGEARALLAKLETDSRELRLLPMVSAPVDLTNAVLGRIASVKKPTRKPRLATRAPQRALPAWYGYAAAAAILFVVGLGSFLLNAPTPTESADPTVPLVKNSGGEPIVEPKAKDREVVKVKTPGSPEKPDEMDPPPDEEPMVETPKKVLPMPVDKPEDPVLTAGGTETPGKFERVELALPVIYDMHKLEGERSEKLQAEFAANGAYRVEILCRDATRGFDRLRAAFAERKWTLQYDPAAQLRLKRPLWRTDYAIFVENLTPADVTTLLRSAGVADRLAGEKKVSEYRFDAALLVKPLSPWDRRELVDLLGVDPVATRPTPMKKAVDIRKPLSEHTVAQVEAMLDGKGVQRPGTSVAPQAYVVPLTGPKSRPTELKRFIEGRVPAVVGTVQVFFVLRNVGG